MQNRLGKYFGILLLFILTFVMLSQGGLAFAYDEADGLLSESVKTQKLGASIFASEAIIPIDRTRSLDDIVGMSKLLTHSGFTNAKAGFAENPNYSPAYSAGSLNTADISDAVNTVKMVRYIAGLPYENISFPAELNNISQHGAVLMSASDQFTNNPTQPADMNETFYAKGYSGCKYANICRGVNNLSKAVLSFMAESGADNIERASHRRWILQPETEKFGMGYASKEGIAQTDRISMYVGTQTGNSDSYVSWPSSGDFPIQYFINSTSLTTTAVNPWSINLGAPYKEINKDDITLKLTRVRDNKVWTFNKDIKNLGRDGLTDGAMHLSVDNLDYGMSKAIIFRPDVTSLGVIKNGDVFKVELMGIQYTDGSDAALSYQTRFFDLEGESVRSRINFVVKHNGSPLSDALITIDGQTLNTDADGTATLRVDNNKAYNYTLTKSGYNTETGIINMEAAEITKTIDTTMPVTFTLSDDNVTYNGEKQGINISARPDAAYTVTYNGSADLPEDAGTYAVFVSVNAPGYTGSKTGSFTIGKANITIKADDKVKKTGGTDPELTYTVMSGQLYKGDTVTGVMMREVGEAVGTYAIKQNTFTLSSNYNLTFIQGVFRITEKIPQEPSVTGLANKIYGDADFALTVTPDSTSTLDSFTYASSNTNVAQISDSGVITIKGAGETIITVTEPGNDEYAAYTYTAGLTVAKKDLKITAKNKVMTYGNILPDFDFLYDGFIAGEDEAVLTTPAGVVQFPAKIVAGTHDIQPSGAVSANYQITYIKGELQVDKREITISELKVFNKKKDDTFGGTINSSSLVFANAVSGDDLSIDFLKAVVTFDSKEMADNVPVIISNIELVGADASNYELKSAEFTTTASIKDKLTAQDIADQILAIPALKVDATELIYPSVPPGFRITVKTSSNAAVSVDGKVLPVAVNTPVKLVFTVTNIDDRTDTASTGELTVTVLASTKVTITITTEGYGAVTGAGEYLKNAKVSLSATANSGYTFSGWYDGATQLSSDTKYEFTALEDKTIIAKFTQVSTPASRPGSGSTGSTGSSGSYTMPNQNNNTQTNKSSNPFEDINENDWFYNAVLFVADKGITVGISPTEYAPKMTVTRAQFITMLCRAYNIEERTGDNFSDAGDSWYTGYIAAAKQLGISDGIGDNMFGPNMEVTREQMVTLIFNYFKSIGQIPAETNLVTLTYSDIDQISDWAYESVVFSTFKQWVKGREDNTFDPKCTATRAELAQIFYNIFSIK